MGSERGRARKREKVAGAQSKHGLDGPRSNEPCLLLSGRERERGTEREGERELMHLYSSNVQPFRRPQRPAAICYKSI